MPDKSAKIETVHPYKSGKGIGLATQVFLGLHASVNALVALFSLPAMHYAVEKDVENSNLFTQGFEALGNFQLLIHIIAGILFIIWLRRMRNNLASLGVTDLVSKPWQVIWSWIIPIYFLWKPFTVTMEIWRASTPDYVEQGAWHRAKSSQLIYFWWGFFLIWHFCGKLSDMMVSLGVRSNDPLSIAGAVALGDLICAPPGIISAVLAILLIKDLNRRQDKRRMALPVVPDSERPASDQ